jgi:translocation and assembly module TamA
MTATHFLSATVRINAILLLLLATTVCADEVTFEINGITGVLLENVSSHVETSGLTGNFLTSGTDYQRMAETAETRVRSALKPFGYYHPEITSKYIPAAEGGGRIVLQIVVGEPVIVAKFNVEIVGDAVNYKPLQEWRASKPIAVGDVLDQTLWESYKQTALDIAESRGYLQRSFSEQSIEIDLTLNRAVLNLVLDTGRRSVMGDIVFEQDIVQLAVLEDLPRFAKGDPYSRFLIERLHSDFWQSGYFTEIEIEERRRTDVNPPVVDLRIIGSSSRRNTYQGSIGVGSDTGPRLQAGWTRQPLSSLGDRIDVLLGWQQRDDEIVFRSNYRIPRRSEDRQFWTGELVVKTEAQDFRFKENPDDAEATELAAGRVDDFFLKGGRLKVRNLRGDGDQVFETIFAQALVERKELDLLSTIPPELLPSSNVIDFEDLIRSTSETLSFGYQWDRPSVRGRGFETVGTRDNAWVFASNETWGSELDFIQFYASTRRHYVVGERLKFLLRAEVGYTEAGVSEFSVEVDNRPVTISVTGLPDLYRFRAGGSASVRGYGFEDLSNNDLGSNHIITASAEVEFKVLEKWSAAAFFDIGNAFNDWSEPNLRKGVGVGVRWYTIFGPIRVDVARAIDYEEKPWRVHFTIGTPLL